MSTQSGVTHLLSSSQLAIWTGQRLQPGEPLYNMVLCFEIQGELDPGLFQQAFGKLLEQSDALRMRVIQDSESPRQTFDYPFPYEVEVVDFSGEADPQSTYRQWLDAHRMRNFDISDCLFESALLRLGQERWVWYFNQHHLATDASTTALLFKLMQANYGLAREARLDEAVEIPTYRDYLALEQAAHCSPAFQRAQDFWQDSLRTPMQPSSFYRSVPAERSGQTERVTRPLGKERSRRLRDLAAEDAFQAFTPDLARFQLFATLFFAWLYRITGNSRLAIGTPTHNRVSPQFRATPGLFIEVFPLQLSVDPADRFVDLHARVASANQQLLINTAPGVSGSGQNRAYDVLLNYITASFGEFDGMPVSSEWVHAGYGDRNHLLRIQVQDFDQTGEFVLHFDMNVDAFDESERQQAVGNFLSLMDTLIEDPQQEIKNVSLVSEDERQQLIETGNGPAAADRSWQTVVDGFSAQANRSPGEVALVCGDRTLSYEQLDQRIGQLMAILSERGIGPCSRVALCLPRSIEAVVAVYTVLRCGAAYVPLDPMLPTERIAFILDDADVGCVLAVSQTIGSLPNLADNVVLLDALDLDTVVGQSLHKGHLMPGADEPCYLIYTSGSTGRPKGVVVCHGGLANYIDWAQRHYLGGETLDFALFSNLAFDLTVTSLFVPLLSGGRLIIYPERDDRREMTIKRVIEDKQASIIKLTPAHLSLIQTMDLAGSSLRKLIVGGEDLKTDLVRAVVRRFADNVDVYNEYGPTEGTVACMIHRYDPRTDTVGSVPIGRAIDGTQILLLDDALNPLPRGVVGQIYIGGAGVAAGYLNDPQQTARRFVENPLGEGRLYASGDLGRWDEHGVMHYLGRDDHQVKIRGVRIELGELEAALLAHPAITECTVLAVDRVDPVRDAADEAFCQVCGISGRHPDAQLDDANVCRICRDYEQQPDKTHGYFGKMDDLHRLVDRVRAEKTGKYDCLALLSGGKDSTYALCRLVEIGLTPLVFTLDNGYISDGAKANIRRLTDSLGLDLHVGATPAMNNIFVDSLQRHSNVCNGCFKVIYTLSMNLARAHGIRYITTGLSRGQIFETRLADLFRHRIYDAAYIDRMIIEARKAYHRLDDVVSRELDTAIFTDDAVFEEIQFIDFYRYCEVSLDEIYDYLGRQAGWVRPADTGRSTNCLINEAGIYVHKTELGFHNYSLPYSWDVRLGHKARDAAREELDDHIDVDNVRRILSEIGYQGEASAPVVVQDKRLVAYYATTTDLPAEALRDFLKHRLPDEMVPSQFAALDALPLTRNGKVDRDALVNLAPTPIRSHGYIAPVGDVEQRLAQLWAEVIGVERVGRDDNFFDLGGDSILNIQIVSRAQRHGLAITSQQIFDHPSISALGVVVGRLDTVAAEQGEVIGEVPVAPIQQRHFDSGDPVPDSCSQYVLLRLPPGVRPEQLEPALSFLLRQHDGLRSRFVRSEGAWFQRLLSCDEMASWPMEWVDASGMDKNALISRGRRFIQQQHESLDPRQGPMLAAAYLAGGAGHADHLLLLTHHLLVDGVSWRILIEDLQAVLDQLNQGGAVRLPDKTSSVLAWSKALGRFANSPACRDELDFWLGSSMVRAPLPRDGGVGTVGQSEHASVSRRLGASLTGELLHGVPKAYNTRVADVLLTALAQAMATWGGARELLLDIEGRGREEIPGGVDLLRTVGWFTNVYPARLQCDPTQQLGQTLVSIKEQLRAIPRNGMAYGASRYLNDDSDVRERLAACGDREVLFNYMGQWDQGTGDEAIRLVQPIGVFAGTAERGRYLLEINAVVFDGSLHVDWTYRGEALRTATVERLADDFDTCLRALISHCLSRDVGGMTPSDVPHADIDQDVLDDLLAEFGEE